VEATAKLVEIALNDAAHRFGVELDAVDQPATTSSLVTRAPLAIGWTAVIESVRCYRAHEGGTIVTA